MKRPPTRRQRAWLAAQSAEALDEADHQALRVISQINLTLKTAVEIAQRFSTTVCRR
jgi:hypothetical protein